MSESIKKEIWNILRLKNISFAMLYKASGDIIWQQGRETNCTNVKSGSGFSRELIDKTWKQPGILDSYGAGDHINLLKTLSVAPPDPGIKSIVILSIENRRQYFFYLESREQDYFTYRETVMFAHLAAVLRDSGETAAYKTEDIPPIRISGGSNAINAVKTRVVTYAVETEPILLLGETGVGKNHIAKLIHHLSGRGGKFVQVHTPSIPEELFESEVFGHKKGSFTGAIDDRKGLVDFARGGTLFFDEISEVPLTFQAKLLQFLDTRKYRRLGESREKESDVRIIAATNKDLEEEVEEKRFRKDLYYRLNVLPIEIPPLRERKEDIKTIVRAEIHHLRGKKISEGFWKEVSGYQWPGNVRELIHVLKRAGIELESPIKAADIHSLIHSTPSHTRRKKEENVPDKILKDLEEGKTFWKVVKEPFLNRDLNREQVRAVISKAQMKVGGKYKNLLHLFGIRESEYKNFMSFLYDNDLK